MGVGDLHSKLFSAPHPAGGLILFSARGNPLSMPGSGNFRSVTLSSVV
jgi:hypothetical protein